MTLAPTEISNETHLSCSTPNGIGLLYRNKNLTAEPLSFCQPFSDFSKGEWSFRPGLWMQFQNSVTFAYQGPGTKRVGIGTQIPPMKLSIFPQSDMPGGLLAVGQEHFPLDDLLSRYSDVDRGDFPLFLWYAQKGAFRAQYMDSSQNNLWNENNIGYYSTALGHTNIAAGRSSFAAGKNNQAWNHLTAITGGQGNLIQIPDSSSALNQRFGSTIVGGFNNTIAGPRNVIGGGKENAINNANSSAIGGGFNNRIEDNYTTPNQLLNANFLDETHSIILGGDRNSNYGRRCAISGGRLNTIDPDVSYSSIIGGARNIIESGTHSVIMGNNDGTFDRLNRLSGSFSVSLITERNLYNPITGNHNFVMGSANGNFLVSLSSTSSTNINHAASFTFSGVALANYSFIGNRNSFYMNSADYSVALNGSHRMTGKHSFATSVGSISFVGNFDGNYAVTHGDRSTGSYSWTFRTHATGSDKHYNNNRSTPSFVFGALPSALSTAHRFILFADRDGHKMKVGIGVNQPQKTLEVAGKIKANVFQLAIPTTNSALPDVYRHSTSGEIFYQDLAEVFAATGQVEPGDIVVIDSENPDKVIKSSRAYDQSVIGVVSQRPAVIFTGDTVLMPTAEQVLSEPPVALAGKIKIKVCLENGPIKRGDLLTSSSMPGTAMKAGQNIETQNAIIAKALEDFTKPNHENESGEIIAIIMIR